MVKLFSMFSCEFILMCVVIYDPVQDVETVFGLCKQLSTYRKNG